MNSFKNIKCGLGLHSYKSIGTQSVTNTVGGFSMTPLNWQPKLNTNE